MGRRGAGLTRMETRREVIVRAAVLADELGYETFAVPEAWGPEQLEPWDQAADIVTILLPPGMPWGTIEATLRPRRRASDPGGYVQS